MMIVSSDGEDKKEKGTRSTHIPSLYALARPRPSPPLVSVRCIMPKSQTQVDFCCPADQEIDLGTTKWLLDSYHILERITRLHQALVSISLS